MNNKISNPLLKQLISEIANKANEGRVTNLNWGSLYESKNILKKEADEKDKPSPKEEPADKKGGDDAGELPPLGGPDDAEPSKPTTPEKGKSTNVPTDKDVGADKGAKDKGITPPAGEEDTEKAQADAAKAKAELEKAKAEKDQAEKELKKHSYVKLKSSGGLQFMLGKILNQAFKTNTIDALASDMVQKLKISTKDDATAFEEDMAMYKNIPGMTNLLSSIKGMAVEQPKVPSEEEASK
jgi:hypothetical protein